MTDKQIDVVVDLNVGGKFWTTLLSTLTKETESKLAAMFSEGHVMSKDKDGRFFIDCNGEVFQFILEFLRYGKLPPSEMALDVYDLAHYFGIQSLVGKLSSYNNVLYRNKIESLKNGFGIRRYEMLQQEVIDKMIECNANPADDKLLRFLEHMEPVCNEYSKRYGKLQLGKASLVDETKLTLKTISVITSCQITEEMKMCLTYDLCKMGFGRCTSNIKEQMSNKCCSNLKESHGIMFLANKGQLKVLT